MSDESLILSLSSNEFAFISGAVIPIGLLGIIGNCLSVLVLRRKGMKSPSSTILLGLTFFDLMICVSFTIFFAISVEYYYEDEQSPYSHIGLDIIVYFVYPFSRTAYTGSVYATLLINIERYSAVCWPVSSRGKTVREARISVICVLVIAILVNAIRWFEDVKISMYDSEDSDEKQENELFSHPLFLLYYEGIFWIGIMYVIPFALIAVLNYRIWTQLRIMNSARQQLTINQTSDISLTKMLLTVVLVFFILNLINCSFVIAGILSIGTKRFDQETISNIPILINSSVNFIVYCVCGQKFRNELFEMLKSWDACLRRKKKLEGGSMIHIMSNGNIQENKV